MTTRSRSHELPELWGGLDYTVNRVGDQYFDQLERSGHSVRLSDLDLFAALGFRTLRYPVLWERVAPEGPTNADWTWPDQRLARLQELGIAPIVGLVHHGSGPRFTSLVDPRFPYLLAEYARAVAERYPWVTHYTPVNEPLTTARFSGLYGHWYPHGHDHRTFVRALLLQCEAVVRSMQAIRVVQPKAQLIQTDDLGKVYSTPRLAYQARFENERRWLTWDLLCGLVGPMHPLWSYLRGAGASEAELEWFREQACPPDVIGINHYLSSERFLDERLGRYPSDSHGGNGRDQYADVLAARASARGASGPEVLLEETWDRYHRPLAVTEAHNGCTREEQLRWLAEVWAAACAVRQNGADLRAVTVWSVLGAFDWNQLCTTCDGFYEPGAFDLRSPAPRPTALAAMARALATRGHYEHPVLETPGWWRRPMRLSFAPVRHRGDAVSPHVKPRSRRGAGTPLLITGAHGTLGRALARLCEERGLTYRLLDRSEMDIADRLSVESTVDALHPWGVVNAAGYVRVDDAESDPLACYRENTVGPALLADACAARSIPLVTFSSDLVFNGASRRPYLESDSVCPLNIYGRTKAEAEYWVLKKHPMALIIRTSAFFGPWDDYNFVTVLLRTLSEGLPFVVADDARISPTYVPDLVHATLDLLIDGERGIWHLANPGSITWAELGQEVAERAGLDTQLLIRRPTAELELTASRPLYSVLGSERGWIMPPVQDALARYFQDRTSSGNELQSHGRSMPSLAA